MNSPSPLCVSDDELSEILRRARQIPDDDLRDRYFQRVADALHALHREFDTYDVRSAAISAFNELDLRPHSEADEGEPP